MEAERAYVSFGFLNHENKAGRVKGTRSIVKRNHQLWS